MPIIRKKVESSNEKMFGKIDQLEAELHLKDLLLHRKSEELARAFLKHGHLEQELAFHKLETKLNVGFGEIIGDPLHTSETQTVGGSDDQPYLGMCRFRRRSMPLNRPKGLSDTANTISRRASIDTADGAIHHPGVRCPGEASDKIQTTNVVELHHCKQQFSSDARPATLSLNNSQNQELTANAVPTGRPTSAPTGQRTPAPQLLPSYFKGLSLVSASPTTAICQWIANGHQPADNHFSETSEKAPNISLVGREDFLSKTEKDFSQRIGSPALDRMITQNAIQQGPLDSSVTSSPMTQKSSRTNATGTSAVVLQSSNGDISFTSEGRKRKANHGPKLQDLSNEEADGYSPSDSGLAISHRTPPVRKTTNGHCQSATTFLQRTVCNQPAPKFGGNVAKFAIERPRRITIHDDRMKTDSQSGHSPTSLLVQAPPSCSRLHGGRYFFGEDDEELQHENCTEDQGYPRTPPRSNLNHVKSTHNFHARTSHKHVQQMQCKQQSLSFCADIHYHRRNQSRSRSRSRALSETAQSERATVGSFVPDTLTTVTKHSPSGDDDDLEVSVDSDCQAGHLPSTRPPHVRRVLPQTEDDFGSSQSRKPRGYQPHTTPLQQYPLASDGGAWFTENEVSEASAPEKAFSDPPRDRVYGTGKFLHTPSHRHQRQPPTAAVLSHQQHLHPNHREYRRETGGNPLVHNPRHLAADRRRLQCCSQHQTARGRSLELPKTQHRIAASRQQRRPSRKQLSDSPGGENEFSSETAAIANLTGELVGLRQGLRRTQEANSARLELALKHIALLEFEIQRQRCLDHEAANAHERQIERSQWEKKLAATLTELRQCQTGINDLRSQINSTKPRQSGSHSSAEGKEHGVGLEETKAALEEQKAEIGRLNSMLNRLVGINPVDASLADVQQLQMGIADLNRRIKNDLPQAPMQQVFGNAESLRRCQSLQTGISRAPTQGSMIPGLLGPGVEQAAKNLFCSVPEHHYLEDCVNEMQLRVAQISEDHAEQRRKLRQTSAANKKLEEKIEVQEETIRKLTGRTERLHEDLTKAGHGVKDITEMQDCQNQHINREPVAMATATSLAQRQDELYQLEKRKQEVTCDLNRLQSQISELTGKCDRLREERSQLDGEAFKLRSEIGSARTEFSQLREDILKAQLELSVLNNSKQKALTTIEELEQAVKMKQTSLEKSKVVECDLENKLGRLKSEAEAIDAKLQWQKKALADDESALLERREQADQLNRRNEEDRARSLALSREIGEQKAELDRIQAEKQRNLQQPLISYQEKQHNLLESQFPLSALIDQRTQILQSINDLNCEKRNLQLNVDSQNKALGEISELLSSQRRDLDDLKEESRQEQTRITDLTKQQRDLLDQLGDLQSQLKTKCDQLHDQEMSMVKVTAQLDAVQKDVLREQDTLDRISTERKILEGDAETAKQEVHCLQAKLESLQREIGGLEKRESQLTERMAMEESHLAKLNAELESGKARLKVIRSEVKVAQGEQTEASKQLVETRTELNEAEHRLTRVNSKLSESEQVLSEHESRQSEVAAQLERLNSSVKIGHMANRTIQAEKQAGDLALKTTLQELDRLATDREKIEQELNQLRSIRDSENLNLEKQLAIGCDQLEGLEAAINQKNQELKSAKAELTMIKDKIESLKVTESDLQKATSGINGILNSRETADLQDTGSEQLDILKALSEAKCALAETKMALTASQQDARRLKRRMTRELAEMERVAEEQCNRAGNLTEQLALSRRQYNQLKGKINVYALLMEEVITVASQNEMAEHGKRLEATLASVRAEQSNGKPTLPTDLSILKANCTEIKLHQPDDPTGMTTRSIGNSDLHQTLLRQLTDSFHELSGTASTCLPLLRQSAKPGSVDNQNNRSTTGNSAKTVPPQTSVQRVPPSTENVAAASLTTCGTTSGLGSINSCQWPSEFTSHQSEASTGRTSMQEQERFQNLRDHIQALKYSQAKNSCEARPTQSESRVGSTKPSKVKKRNS